MNSTGELLFEYLKNMLYHPEKASLEIKELPDDFQKLGQGMQQLNEYVQEQRKFAKALARGDLYVTPPGVDNILAAPAKELQGSLRHLTWQIQQVADGDYSQRVDFMGEFSDALNTMTKRLSEQKERLIEERKLAEQRAQDLKSTLELVMALTDYTHNIIYVFSETEEQFIFANQTAGWLEHAYPAIADEMKQRLMEHVIDDTEDSERWDMETESVTKTDGDKIYFWVESFRAPIEGKQDIVHIVIDDTKRRNREQLMYSMAYVDPLTGLYNRRYANDLMERWIREEKPFLVSFIDIDYLKYCNDNFGHDMGDRYLIELANALKTTRCEICRIGGDEFLVLEPDETDVAEQDEMLEELRTAFKAQKDSPYPKSFSYATCMVPVRPEKPLEEYIRETDVKMYEYKTLHKKKLKGAEDDR